MLPSYELRKEKDENNNNNTTAIQLGYTYLNIIQYCED